MPAPLIAALAPAIIQTVGGLAARAIAGKEKVPNVVQPVINASQQQLADLEDQQRRTLASLEEADARRGNVSLSTSAREDLLTANARGNASIRGNILDSLAAARREQEILNADVANRRRAGIIQGITGGAAAIGEGVGSFLNPVDTAASLAPSTPVGIGSAAQGGVLPTPSVTPAVRPNLTAQVNSAINPANQLVELDYRPGQSLTSFSTPRASLASTMGTFANNFFTTLQ